MIHVIVYKQAKQGLPALNSILTKLYSGLGHSNPLGYIQYTVQFPVLVACVTFPVKTPVHSLNIMS